MHAVSHARIRCFLGQVALLLCLGVLPLPLQADDQPYDYATAPSGEAFRKEGAFVLNLLLEKDFKKLDDYLDDLRTQNAKYRDGGVRLHGCLKIVGDGKPNKDEWIDTHEGYQERIKLLEEWRKQAPRSMSARICLARAWMNWGYLSRGTGYAHTVTEDGFNKLRERHAIAEEILDSIEEDFKEFDIPYYRARIDLSYGTGEAPSLDWLHRAVKLDPLSLECTHATARLYAQRWYGQPGLLEEILDDLSERTKAEAGEIHYLYAALSLLDTDYDRIFTLYNFDWDRMKQGMRDWRKRYPQGNQMFGDYVKLAVLMDDFEEARTLAPLMDEDPKLQWWRGAADFKTWKQRLAKEVHEGEHTLRRTTHFGNLITCSLSPDPDSRYLICINDANKYWINDLEQGIRSPVLTIDEAIPRTMSVSWATGLMAIGCNRAPYLRLYPLGQDRGTGIATDLLQAAPLKLIPSDTGRLLLALEKGSQQLLIIDLENQVIQARAELDDKPVPFVTGRFSSDEKWLVVGMHKGVVKIVNTETGEVTASRSIGGGNIGAVAFGPQGDLVAAIIAGDKVCVLQMADLQVVAQRKMVGIQSYGMAFSPDQQRLAIAMKKPNQKETFPDPLRIWEFPQGDKLTLLHGHQYGAHFVAWKSNAELISSAYDWTTRLWNVPAADGE